MQVALLGGTALFARRSMYDRLTSALLEGLPQKAGPPPEFRRRPCDRLTVREPSLRCERQGGLASWAQPPVAGCHLLGQDAQPGCGFRRGQRLSGCALYGGQIGLRSISARIERDVVNKEAAAQEDVGLGAEDKRDLLPGKAGQVNLVVGPLAGLLITAKVEVA